MATDLLSINDLSDAEIQSALDLGAAYRARTVHSMPLAGRSVAMLFEKPSLRTKVSFEVAVHELGGNAIYLSRDEVGLDSREPVEDVAHVLERWVAAIVARVNRHASLLRLADASDVPVVNALSDVEHPCQALADLMTIQQHKGRLDGLKVAHVGDANNCALSLGLGCAAVGARFATLTVMEAVELLLSLIEARRGGETGVSQVEVLHGEQLQQALDSGRISRDLVQRAMRAEIEGGFQRQPWPGRDISTVARPITPEMFFRINHGLLLKYRDGTRASVLSIADSSDRWNFSCRLRGTSTPLSTSLYNGPWGNRCLFKALSHAIQQMFISGRPSYPVERTLLVSGVLDAAMTSLERPLNSCNTTFAFTRLN